MPLESATYISQLQPLNPDGEDGVNEGDNHIRMVKFVLQSQFPEFKTAAPVTASIAEMNRLVGVTSAIQTQIDAKAPIASPSFTGTPLAPTPSGSIGGAIANVTYVGSAVAGVGTLGDLVDTYITTTGTSAVNTRELIDTTGGVIVRTLPSGAAIGAIIAYKDNAANFSNNKLSITPATGEKIENSATNEVMDVTERFSYFALKKTDATTWRVL